VVATRYFGGVKLGAGGLVRNYAKTAKLAVQEAGIVEYMETKKYVLDFSYDRVDEIESVVLGEGGEILEKEYLDRVTYRVSLEKETADKIKSMRGIVIFEI